MVTAWCFKKFTSTQRVIAQRPGFDWEGRIEMIPGLTARVHDAYIGAARVLAGRNALHAACTRATAAPCSGPEWDKLPPSA